MTLGLDELLLTYVRLIREVSQADKVSLYLPVDAAPSAEPVLLHDGDGAPLPELADLEAAHAFSDRAAEERRKSGVAVALWRVESRVAAGRLVGVPSLEVLASRGAGGPPELGRRRSDRSSAGTVAAWLGLRFDGEPTRVRERLAALEASLGSAPEDAPRDWWTWFLAVGGSLAWHASWVSILLVDPVSQLPGRTELQAVLRQQARLSDPPHALLLISPDDFGLINEQFGRESGDEVISEIAERLATALRRSDFIGRYGGAVFASVLPGVARTEGLAVVTKVRQRLTEEAYSNGAVRLSFSFGLAASEDLEAKGPGGAEPDLELLRRADQALNAAKLAGGGRLVVWKAGSRLEQIEQLDRLSGIFTANLTKDYRNMLLLWDTVSVVAERSDFDGMVRRVVGKLSSTLKPDWVGLYFVDDDRGDWSLQGAVSRMNEGEPAAGSPAGDEASPLSAERRSLLDEAHREGHPREGRFRDAEADPARGERIAWAVPLAAGDLALGSLYLEGAAGRFKLDASDLIFLEALTRQLAVAFDRARLAQQERLHEEQERRRLRSELNELRQALQQAKLVYGSPEMEAVLDVARRAAGTDATILIGGESGTGKELLARTIHQLSARREGKLVVVDCSAISTSLIDSELFGHSKGAFTGAVERSTGRLAEAEGGTVLLDEIGELPLEVQSKLLRFVQEKQVVPVGSSRPRRVDARVIAVTNRDLAAEVEAGRFRRDLFYRLNVVHLVAPPLRQRRGDVVPLARYFLEQASVQYQKRVHGLTPAAETRLLAHSWPGNVRELQNRVMQAVVLCEGEEIGPRELGLEEPSALDDLRPGEEVEDGRGEPAEASTASSAERWAALRLALARLVETLVGGRPVRPVPLGRWLNDDLVLEADRASGGVQRQGAALLGAPEATYRRRLRKARRESAAGLSPRSAGWEPVADRIRDLLAGAAPATESLLDRAQATLLEEVATRVADDSELGAALLGVTLPTFRRRLAATEGGGPASSPRAPR